MRTAIGGATLVAALLAGACEDGRRYRPGPGGGGAGPGYDDRADRPMLPAPADPLLATPRPLTLTSAGDLLIEGALDSGGGDITITVEDGELVVTATLNSGGGAIDLGADGALLVHGDMVTDGGDVNLASGDDIDVAAPITTVGSNAGGTVRIDAEGTVRLAAEIDVRGPRPGAIVIGEELAPADVQVEVPPALGGGALYR